MFGLFKKKLDTFDAILIAFSAGVLTQEEEMNNGGKPTNPSILLNRVRDSAANLGFKNVNQGELNMIGIFATRLLVEKKLLKTFNAATTEELARLFSDPSFLERLQNVIPELKK